MTPYSIESALAAYLATTAGDVPVFTGTSADSLPNSPIIAISCGELTGAAAAKFASGDVEIILSSPALTDDPSALDAHWELGTSLLAAVADKSALASGFTADDCTLAGSHIVSSASVTEGMRWHYRITLRVAVAILTPAP